MIAKRALVAGLAAGIVLAAGIGSGWAQQRGTAEKVGEKIDDALKGVKRGARDLGEDLRARFERARTSVNDMGVEARVYSRLHWDKALNSSKLEVEVRQGGVTTLRGTVPDEAARAKAVELTKDTVGVASVADQLALTPAGTTAPAPKP